MSKPSGKAVVAPTAPPKTARRKIIGGENLGNPVRLVMLRIGSTENSCKVASFLSVVQLGPRIVAAGLLPPQHGLGLIACERSCHCTSKLRQYRDRWSGLRLQAKR